VIPQVPWRELEEIRNSADLFLDAYCPSRNIPVPIEDIIELDMRLEIRPIHRLRQRFGFDGSLFVNLQTIVVDATLQTHYLNRYRFTLAHEIAHRVLHAEQIGALSLNTDEEWKTAIQAIPARDYARMEFQADEFAGRVLVPRQPLLEMYQRSGELAKAHGIDLAEMQDTSLLYVAGWIAKRFDVSTDVVEIRLKREGIILSRDLDLLPLPSSPSQSPLCPHHLRRLIVTPADLSCLYHPP
jgi:predicted SprT family Zn-dependent metalloprotease